MSKFAQGIYEIKNPEKYLGTKKPRYRSGWELTFMMFCDNNKSVLNWASESIQIPYRNPITGKHTVYIPDFFVVYQNKHRQQVAELVEIKPKKQTTLQEAGKSRSAQMAAILNQAKWQAAGAYCKRMGITFRVITEDQLFHNGKR